MNNLEVNVNGAQIVTAAFLPLLRKGSRKLVVNVYVLGTNSKGDMQMMLTFFLRSSTLSSITLAQKYAFQPAPAYKISKTALNMLTVQWALQFAQEGFTFICINPGVSPGILRYAGYVN